MLTLCFYNCVDYELRSLWYSLFSPWLRLSMEIREVVDCHLNGPSCSLFMILFYSRNKVIWDLYFTSESIVIGKRHRFPPKLVTKSHLHASTIMTTYYTFLLFKSELISPCYVQHHSHSMWCVLHSLTRQRHVINSILLIFFLLSFLYYLNFILLIIAYTN